MDHWHLKTAFLLSLKHGKVIIRSCIVSLECRTPRKKFHALQGYQPDSNEKFLVHSTATKEHLHAIIKTLTTPGEKKTM